MTWIQTKGQRAFDLLIPKPDQVDLGDICHALANINRFTGHVGAYSVAAHSLVVASIAVELCEPLLDEWAEDGLPLERARSLVRLDGLLHDAHEAYLGALSSPLKRAMPAEVRGWFGRVTERVQSTIEDALGCRWGVERQWWAPLIREADLLALDAERKVLGLWPEARDWGPLPASSERHRQMVLDWCYDIRPATSIGECLLEAIVEEREVLEAAA